MMRTRPRYFAAIAVLLLGLLAACNLQPEPPIEIPDLSFEVQPAETQELGVIGSEDVGPEIELVNAPEWVHLADAAGEPVDRCALYEPGCQLVIDEDAPAGVYNLTVRFIFKNDVAVSGTITIEVKPKITIEPEEVELSPGEQIQFQARVYGGEDGGVAWSATCGSIDDQGWYTAPLEGATCEVTASSLEFEDLVAVATVTVRPQASLTVDVTPDDAEVQVTGPAGFEVSFVGDRTLEGLDPGLYTVSATHPDYFPAQDEVELQDGDQKTVELSLEPRPPFDFLPHLVLTNEGTSSDAHETTVEVGTVITVYWGMRVEPESAIDDARAAVSDPGLVLELYWKGAGDEDYERLARIYQMPGDEDRVYALPKAEAGENRVRVVVDPDNQVLEANDDNNVDEWIIYGQGDEQNQPPSVDLSASPTQGYLPLEVNFTARASDPDGSIVRYEWDLDGNGSYETSGTSPSASYTYQTEGVYYPTVRVTDDAGAVATDRVRIEVYDQTTDGEPPTVAWVEPADGATVTGPVVFQLEVEGDRPTVDYYINDTLVASNLVSPYSYEWNPTAADNGEAVLKAVAKDPDGEAEAQITVTVDVVDRTLWETSAYDYGTPAAGFTLVGSNAYVGTNYGRVLKVASDGSLWASEALSEAITTEVVPDASETSVYVHTPKGYIYSISLSDGTAAWSADLGVNYTAPPPPAVLTDGILWVAGANPVDSGENSCVYPLDPGTGEALGDPVCFAAYIEALVPISDTDGVLAVEEAGLSTILLHRIYQDAEGAFTSVSSEKLSAMLADGVEPTVSGPYVYVPSQFEQIVRVDWDSLSDVTYIDTDVNHRSPLVPVILNDALAYFAVNDGGNLSLLDPETGAAAWTASSTGMSVEAAPAFNPDREELYAVSAEGVVRAYDLQGNLRFSYQLPGSGEVALTPAYLGSDVLLVARYRTLFGVDLGD